MRLLRLFLLLTSSFFISAALRADDGYRLWLRYDRIADNGLRARYAAALSQLTLATGDDPASPRLAAAKAELEQGIAGLVGITPAIAIVQTTGPYPASGPNDGYTLTASSPGKITLSGQTDLGVLYGAFALLRHLQLGLPLENLDS